MRTKKQINLFGYRDYRVYLHDWLEATKQTRARVSYRTFAKRAGFQSSNFMMLVIQGKRNLSEESLKKVVTGLRLNKQEEEFFRNLVFFNQAESPQDKNFYYGKLVRTRKFRELQPIEQRQYQYYSAWYHPVVRELVVSKYFDGTPESIAHRIFPPITAAQVAKSVELLASLGFIKRNGDGRWQQASTVISTGPELISMVVHNYHKGLLDLSKEVMDKISLKEREVSSLTLGVKRERLGEMREKIREFRQEILKIASEDTEPEAVVMMNLQFFPVTKKEEEVI